MEKVKMPAKSVTGNFSSTKCYSNREKTLSIGTSSLSV